MLTVAEERLPHPIQVLTRLWIIAYTTLLLILLSGLAVLFWGIRKLIVKKKGGREQKRT